MKKLIALLCSLSCCLAAHAEWYQVKAVTSYNQIVAFKPNEATNEIKIRIKNLQNIEDIPMGRSKVLLAGKSAQDLAKETLEGQLVWIEDLQEESGIYTGVIYLSYEQMVRSFANQRMVGGQSVAPEIKSAIKEIYRRMLRDLDTASTFEDETRLAEARKTIFEGKSFFSHEKCYEFDYLKSLFIYESLEWFKKEGQFLPFDVQKMFISWVAQYQTAQPQRAKALEQKIRDMTVRYGLYKDFIFDE